MFDGLIEKFSGGELNKEHFITSVKQCIETNNKESLEIILQGKYTDNLSSPIIVENFVFLISNALNNKNQDAFKLLMQKYSELQLTQEDFYELLNLTITNNNVEAYELLNNKYNQVQNIVDDYSSIQENSSDEHSYNDFNNDEVSLKGNFAFVVDNVTNIGDYSL
ncbi:MAG: hypothetical protein HRU35_07925 [Rickettsiaceae bacterium]|nr:hypothetical protein [Rickettsiaceae bacterium]